MQIYADSGGDAPPGYHRNQRLSDSLVTPKDELFAELKASLRRSESLRF